MNHLHQILFNVSTSSLYHSFHTASDSFDRPGNLHRIQVAHGGGDGPLQGVEVWVAGLAGLCLSSAPQVVITGVQVRAVGGLLLGRPDVEGLTHSKQFLIREKSHVPGSGLHRWDELLAPDDPGLSVEWSEEVPDMKLL